MRMDLIFPVAALTAIFLACSGCAAQDREPEAKSPGFVWIQVGTDSQGCALFTKKSTSPQVLVDTAIWYRNAQGKYTLDAHSCAPQK